MWMSVNERFAIYKSVRYRLVIISNKQCVNKPVFLLRAHFFKFALHWVGPSCKIVYS